MNNLIFLTLDEICLTIRMQSNFVQTDAQTTIMRISVGGQFLPWKKIFIVSLLLNSTAHENTQWKNQRYNHPNEYENPRTKLMC